MRAESVDRRVLGAVRYLDATTGLQILTALTVRADGVRWIRNRRSCYVIAGGPGLEHHAGSFFEAPGTPALGGIAVHSTVADPRGQYLPRRHTIRLPRDPNPAHAARPDSLFRPIDVHLFPSPIAETAPGWAVIRASVTEEASVRAVAGALIRVLRASDSRFLASGLTDGRGEALVAVPGIPVTTWEAGPGPVLATEVEVILEVVVDPAAGDIPDPDDLEARRVELPVRRSRAMLASGRVLVAALPVTIP